MVQWHHRLDGCEFEQGPGVGDGQGSLVWWSPWGCKELDMTERLNCTDTVIKIIECNVIYYVCKISHTILHEKLKVKFNITISSVQFSHSVMSNSLWPHESQHARPPCPSPTPGVPPNPCPSSRWCHWTISFSVVPFSSCPQSFPASGSFPMSQLFASGGQSIGVSVSASVLPMNTWDWSPLGWMGWTSLQSKGLSRVFSNTTVQKHQFFGAKLSL